MHFELYYGRGEAGKADAVCRVFYLYNGNRARGRSDGRRVSDPVPAAAIS